MRPQARTSRLKDSFIHQAVRKLNSLPSLPPLLSFAPCTIELWPSDSPPTHTQTVTSTSHFVQHWTDIIHLPLLTVWIKTALWAFCHFKYTDKLFYTTPFISALFVYFTGLHSIYHVPYATLFFYYFSFFTCPYLYICNSCIIYIYKYIYIYTVYIYTYIFDLYLSVFLHSTVIV